MLGCSHAMYSASDYVCIGFHGWKKSSMAGELLRSRGTDVGAAGRKAQPRILCSSGCSRNPQAAFGLVRSGPVHVEQKRDVSVGAGRRKKKSPGGRIEKRVPWMEMLGGPSQEEMDKAIAEADIVYNDDYYKYGPYGPYAWKGLISGKPKMGDFTTHDGVVLYSSVRDEEEHEERDKYEQCMIYGKKLDMMDEKVGIKYFFVFVRSTRRRRWQIPWKEWTLAAQVAVESGEKLDKWAIGRQVDLRARHGVTRCVAWCRPDLVYVKRPQYQMRYEPQEEFILGLLELLNPETEMKGIVGTDLEEMKKQTYYYKLCEKLGVQQSASEDEILAAFANLDEARRLVVLEHMLCSHRVQLLHPFTLSWRDKERREARAAAAEGREMGSDGGNAEQEKEEEEEDEMQQHEDDVGDDEDEEGGDEQEEVDEAADEEEDYEEGDEDEEDDDEEEVDEDEDDEEFEDDEDDESEDEDDEAENDETKDGDDNADSHNEVHNKEKELNGSDQGEKASNFDARIEATEGFATRNKRKKKDDYFGGKGNPLRRRGLTSWQRDYWKAVLPTPSAMKRIPRELYFHHFDHLDNSDDEAENWNFEPGTGLKAAVRPFTYTDMLQEIVFIRRQYACYR